MMMLHNEPGSKAPVTPSRVSTTLALSCLIFQGAVRSQENPDIVREKGLSLRSYSKYGIATELAWHSFPFLQSSCCRFAVLSRRRFHGAHNVCTVLSWPSHCADVVTSKRMRHNNLRVSPTDDHGVCTTTLVCSRQAPIAL